MPSRIAITGDLSEVARAYGAGDPPDWMPQRVIAPGAEIPVICDDRSMRLMRWGLVPVGRVNARGRPVMEVIHNARSETVFDKSAYAGVKRGLVPVTGWYETTGKGRSAENWWLTPVAQPVVFAAIWDSWTAPGGRVLDQVAVLTCEPNGEVAPIHHRMGVLLPPEQAVTWLEGSPDEAGSVLVTPPDGSVAISPAGDIDLGR